MTGKRVLAVYACLSAVYLLYVPFALPVLDDWMYLQVFAQARAGGVGGEIAFLRHLIDNSWLSQFRTFWAGVAPVYALSLVAGFSGWPYFLLAWSAHLATALLLRRLVTALSGEEWLGFAAGAVYVVFPASNNALFWSVSNCFYYLQALVFLWWLCSLWSKLALRQDYRYRWKDFLLLALVAFTGEQILPALLLLPPLTFWLFGREEDRRPFLRFWSAQSAAAIALLGFYTLVINRMPIAQGFHNRYQDAPRWSPWPVAARLFASLGLMPGLAEWRPAWRVDATLLALLAAAAIAFFWGARRLGRDPVPGARPAKREMAKLTPAKLLLWSAAGAALTYLPVALLPGIEWRYLYVPAVFLVSGGVAALAALGRRACLALAFLATAYGLSLTYFEMRQCWIPESRVARAMIEALAASAPVREGAVVIFAHAPHAIGPAPSFIAGASWSQNSMLEHYTGAKGVEGARELLVNRQGELALYRRDSLAPFTSAGIPRLRVFVRAEDGRFVPKSLLALPAPGDRYQLLPLSSRDHKGVAPESPLVPGVPLLPEAPLTMEELKRLPLFPEIYFAHLFDGLLPHA